MSILLQVRNATKSFGSRTLFDDAGFSVSTGDSVAVIGPNGAGKSTLFKVLAELDEFDSGEVIRSRELRLGYLAQDDDFTTDTRVREYLEEKATMPIWDLFRLGRRLGLENRHIEGRFQDLSGGFRMRCKLLALLGAEPNLLLLDEPTNYLDLESLLALERFLAEYRGAFMVISHDREFLRRTTDQVLEVEGGQFTSFSADLDEYLEAKALWREQQLKAAESQAAERQAILDFATRFGAKASKARQAQSRLKRLEKMQAIEVRSLPVRARIQIPSPIRTGKHALTVEDLHLGYGSHVILKGVDLQLQRGDHAAIVGVNGAGKTTLLKALAGELVPFSGSVFWGASVTTGYYAQHVSERLVAGDGVYEALMRKAHPEVTPQEVRNLAGSLLFTADDIEKKIRVLSGGERARVALGQILLQKHPVLILDEPTNHLDFETVEALTQALSGFEGTLLAVSHDRSFIRRLATKVIEVRDGGARLYPGTYEEYVWSVERQQSEAEGGEESSSPRPARNAVKPEPPKPDTDRRDRKAQERDRRRNAKELERLEREMVRLQAELARLNQELIVASGPIVQDLVTQMADVQKKLEIAEESWLALV